MYRIVTGPLCQYQHISSHALEHATLCPLPPSSLSLTPRPRTNAILDLIRKRSTPLRGDRVNGEGRSKLWILASGRHTLSHSLLSDTPVTMSLKAILKNRFRLILSLLQCCECYDAIMPLADTDLHSYAVRPCRERKLACNFKQG